MLTVLAGHNLMMDWGSVLHENEIQKIIYSRGIWLNSCYIMLSLRIFSALFSRKLTVWLCKSIQDPRIANSHVLILVLVINKVNYLLIIVHKKKNHLLIIMLCYYDFKVLIMFTWCLISMITIWCWCGEVFV